MATDKANYLASIRIWQGRLNVRRERLRKYRSLNYPTAMIKDEVIAVQVALDKLKELEPNIIW